MGSIDESNRIAFIRQYNNVIRETAVLHKLVYDAGLHDVGLAPIQQALIDWAADTDNKLFEIAENNAKNDR